MSGTNINFVWFKSYMYKSFLQQTHGKKYKTIFWKQKLLEYISEQEIADTIKTGKTKKTSQPKLASYKSKREN